MPHFLQKKKKMTKSKTRHRFTVEPSELTTERLYRIPFWLKTNATFNLAHCLINIHTIHQISNWPIIRTNFLTQCRVYVINYKRCHWYERFTNKYLIMLSNWISNVHHLLACTHISNLIHKCKPQYDNFSEDEYFQYQKSLGPTEIEVLEDSLETSQTHHSLNGNHEGDFITAKPKLESNQLRIYLIILPKNPVLF